MKGLLFLTFIAIAFAYGNDDDEELIQSGKVFLPLEKSTARTKAELTEFSILMRNISLSLKLEVNELKLEIDDVRTKSAWWSTKSDIYKKLGDEASIKSKILVEKAQAITNRVDRLQAQSDYYNMQSTLFKDLAAAA
eukprot:TRINITY_DN5080_c0_g2_i1.p1 TRINITY_DN5080_c0_g2~~TRINITY_DN5080_c0_g2_i1.p1  ORF type:complete len:137 (-),score=40.32 TRINITY_DN5080_c0_g2_i1:75-485(-)